MRWFRIAFAAAALAATGAAAPETWTRAWTASMWQATIPDQHVTVENATIRAAVRVGAGGSKLRLRLANDYGPALAIGAATVRIAGGPAVKLTFDGQGSTLVPQGAPLVSDAAALPVKAFDLVEVSLYLPGTAELATVHAANGAPTQVSAPGDHSGEDFVPARTTPFRPLIAGIDVAGAKARPVVVAYGDSITDNTGCANDAVPVCRWGDVLGRRFAKAGMPQVVVTQAISGNRILATGAGPSALARFDRDVLAMPGVTHVVLLEGINDIGNSGLERNGVKNPEVTAGQLIQGFRQLVDRAHGHGIKVIAMTILPFEGAKYARPEGEAIREKVNDWMRRSGELDGVIDMEKVVGDPANPKRLADPLQFGDNLHPNGAGETKMGEAIPLGLFK